jgi:ubiquinone/menaquinone biosynthesis C-methylase UbiE
VLSAAYADTRLAALYDALNPPGDDTEFYLSLPGKPPQTILDMGCGTGLLACAFAARGHQVTGADPAAAMLAVARGRPGGDQVRWIETDAAGLSVRTRFDLVVLTGHVFQLLLGDDDVRAALDTLGRHLAPGGRIAFETRNPEVREWQYWTPRVTGPLVSYETCIRFPDGERVVVPDTLRFMDQAELAGFLTEAGLADVTWYGDWDRSPVGPASPEIIAIAC